MAGLIQTYLFAERPESDCDTLFLVAMGPNRGKPLTPAGLHTIFRHHRAKVGVPAGHPHALRHTFGTALAEAASTIAEFTQAVIAAAQDFARHGQGGVFPVVAVVFGGQLLVVAVIGRPGAAGALAGLKRRPAQLGGTLAEQMPRCACGCLYRQRTGDRSHWRVATRSPFRRRMSWHASPTNSRRAPRSASPDCALNFV